jgi:hypothetical protein
LENNQKNQENASIKTKIITNNSKKTINEQHIMIVFSQLMTCKSEEDLLPIIKGVRISLKKKKKLDNLNNKRRCDTVTKGHGLFKKKKPKLNSKYQVFIF